MIPQREQDLETFVSRGQAVPDRPQPDVEMVIPGNPYKEDCGCKNKNRDTLPFSYPFSDILPKDPSYIDFLKIQESVPSSLRSVYDKVTSIATLIHSIHNNFPEEAMKDELESLSKSVVRLEKSLKEYNEYLKSREALAKSTLEVDGPWVRVSK